MENEECRSSITFVFRRPYCCLLASRTFLPEYYYVRMESILRVAFFCFVEMMSTLRSKAQPSINVSAPSCAGNYQIF